MAGVGSRKDESLKTSSVSASSLQMERGSGLGGEEARVRGGIRWVEGRGPGRLGRSFGEELGPSFAE